MKTIVAMVNRYGEIIVELERDGDYFYKVPDGHACDFNKLLCVGDEFRVEEIVLED